MKPEKNASPKCNFLRLFLDTLLLLSGDSVDIKKNTWRSEGACMSLGNWGGG